MESVPLVDSKTQTVFLKEKKDKKNKSPNRSRSPKKAKIVKMRKKF